MNCLSHSINMNVLLIVFHMFLMIHWASWGNQINPRRLISILILFLSHMYSIKILYMLQAAFRNGIMCQKHKLPRSGQKFNWNCYKRMFEALLGGLRMSPVWISKPFVSRIEEEATSLSVFYYCICACIRRCRSFNPSLCRLSPFHLSYVAVSRPCRLPEFTLTGPQHSTCQYSHPSLWNKFKSNMLLTRWSTQLNSAWSWMLTFIVLIMTATGNQLRDRW